MSGTLGLAALSAAALAVGAAAPPGSPPIRLEVQDMGDHVRLRVIGDSQKPLEARYSLSVATGDRGNRSTQGGTARVVPGKPATYISLDVSTGTSGDWQATLRVEPAGEDSYTIARSSAD